MTPNQSTDRSVARRFPALYPILDADLVLRGVRPEDRHPLLRRITRAIADAGVEILQYRNKRDADSVVLDDALAIREAAGPTHPMRLILNDRVGLVSAAGWDGVHVGQEDLPPEQVRSTLGANAIVGLSTHNDWQVILADKELIDYIAIGPIFSTASKEDTSPVIGLDGLRRARALTRKPLVAIGGITLETAASVYEAGADSLAVISAIFAPGRDPVQSAKDILEIFK
jgi:thiamine-phosphate pyrophosphorylase